MVPRGVAPGLLLVSAATLGLEVALTRVLSVSLWYHFAFLVVSTAVLGFGLSGVALTLSRRLRGGDGPPAALAGGFALAIVVSFAVCNALPFDPFSLLSDRRQLVLLPIYYLALTLPFFLSGTTVALILMRYTAHAGRLSAWDLVGAGAGAALVVVAFGPLGGSGTVLACAAVAAAGAACLAAARGRRAVALAVALAVGCGGLAVVGERWLPVRVTDNKLIGEPLPVARLLADPRRRLATRWNALGRVDVVKGARGRRILIDGGVATTRLPEARPPYTRDAGVATSEWLAYRLVGGGRDGRSPPGGHAPGSQPATAPAGPGPRVLVIGSGGGWEVLGALAHGARRVVAIEVNPAINRLVRGSQAAYLGGLFADPRVTLLTDEGRSYLRRTSTRFDVIVSAHTISNAATAAGALSLAESYTLTREAFDDYLDHLEEGGYLLFTRPEPHLPRLFATARDALRRHGFDPTRCLAAARGRGAPGRSFDGVFLMRRGPFDAAAVTALRAALAAAHLRPLYLPGDADGAPIYREVLGPDHAALARRASINLVPATDDRPFFNQHRRWSALSLRDVAAVFRQGQGGRLALEDAPVAESALVVFLLQALLLGVLFLILPLGVLRRAGLQARQRGPFLAYFAALGFGFMFVELGLVQRLTLFIGPPTVTFAVVVGALLVTSGIGSHLSGRADPQRRLPVALALAALATLGVALLAPVVARAALGAPLALRAALAALLVAPVGLALGAPFPLGLRLVDARAPALLPWVWGVNGFASVLASAGSLLLATVGGFTSVLLCGVGCYAVALVVARALRPRHS
jgi:hypothetical protein